MKLKFFSLIPLLLAGGFLSAQMPGMMTMQQASGPQGTTLGANTTSGAAGIALGNRVIMRGYVDFIFDYKDVEDQMQQEKFKTSSDIDFLFDFSPVTGEVHINLNPSPNPGKDQVGLEQAFGRYSFNRDFNISFGRQLTVLGYEADEAPGLYSVSNAYLLDVALGTASQLGTLLPAANGVSTRRNYKDGVRANFNNGRFGLTLGLHDGYWVEDDFNQDNIAIDLAASLMIVPGLEARLGYAHQESETLSDSISQFNTWIEWNPNDLTLAFEYDNFDIEKADYWDLLLLANYQFTDFFGATFKYTHEDLEYGADNVEADRFTFALLFTITQNLFFNVEYSHSEVDMGATDYDVEEFYLEGLLTF
jgi:hypothetical protein